MAEIDRLKRALIEADKAGDTEAATKLAQAIRAQQDQPRERGTLEYVDDVVRQIADGATLGYSDEIAAFASSLTGIGEQGGEGADYDANLAAERARDKSFRQDNPIVSTVAQMGGAVMTPGAALLAPAKGASLAANIGRSAGGGALLGGAYGFGAGEGGFSDRLANAPVPALTGAAAGAAVPLLQRGVSNLAGRVSEGRGARQANLSRPAYRMVRGTVADDVATGGGAARIRSAGPEGMLADAGPGASSLLDAASKHPGGLQVAQPAITARAARANQTITGALDDALGAPQGLRQSAKGIAQGSAASRANAYDTAYAKAVDYAAETGRKIEEVLGRIPKSTLTRAVQEANEDMVSRGLSNQQILANIDDAGAVTFREMPNVQQLDEIKKALQKIGYSDIDQFGRPTAPGARARRLAGELREAIGDAIPEYKAATKAGADKIAQDQALDLGRKLLSRTMTREEVQLATKGMNDAERLAAGRGVRIQIDEALANVKRALTDTNMDARQAVQAVKDLSSDAARDKLRMVLGRQKANALFDEIDRATTGLDLKAAIAMNSRTAPRQIFNDTLREQTEEGIVNAARRGEPLQAGKRAIQTLTGSTPADMARVREDMAAEIARVLTGPQGDDALNTLNAMLAQSGREPILREQLRQATGQALLPARPAAAAATVPEPR